MNIRETRQLMLSLQAVLDAVVHYDRTRHGAVLNGEALQAEFVPGGARGAGLAVAVRAAADRTIEWRHLDVELLSRAIIGFCRARRVPLPFAAEKTLTITSQGASLAIENTVTLPTRAAVDTDIAGQPLRYARGYEPHAIEPSSKREVSA